MAPRKSLPKRKWVSIKLEEKTYEVVDPDTGETFRVSPVIRYQAIKEVPFVKVFLEALARNLELTKAQSKVFFWVLQAMDKENLVYVDQKRLAKELGLSYGTVMNTFSLFQKRKLLKKEGPHLYRVNPTVAAKCTAEDRVAILQIFE